MTRIPPASLEGAPRGMAHLALGAPSPTSREPRGSERDTTNDSAHAIELTRAQERDELAARAAEPHGRDAALLEVDPPARQVVDDLAEVGIAADDEHALVGAGGRHQLERRAAVEALGERLLVDRLDAELGAREAGGVAGADL